MRFLRVAANKSDSQREITAFITNMAGEPKYYKELLTCKNILLTDYNVANIDDLSFDQLCEFYILLKLRFAGTLTIRTVVRTVYEVAENRTEDWVEKPGGSSKRLCQP